MPRCRAAAAVPDEGEPFGDLGERLSFAGGGLRRAEAHREREPAGRERQRQPVGGERQAVLHRVAHQGRPREHRRGLHDLQPGVRGGQAGRGNQALHGRALRQEADHRRAGADESAQREERQGAQPQAGERQHHAGDAYRHAALEGLRRGHAVHHHARRQGDEKPGRPGWRPRARPRRRFARTAPPRPAACRRATAGRRPGTLRRRRRGDGRRRSAWAGFSSGLAGGAGARPPPDLREA